MKTEFKAIAMRCNQEQFESLKQILIDFGIKKVDYDDSYEYIFINEYNELDQYRERNLKTQLDSFSEIHNSFCLDTFLIRNGFKEKHTPLDPIFIERYNVTDKARELLEECKKQGLKISINDNIISYEII